MKQKSEEVAHADNRNKAANRLISRQLWISPCTTVTRSSADLRWPQFRKCKSAHHLPPVPQMCRKHSIRDCDVIGEPSR